MGIVHLKGSMLAEYLGGRLDDPSIRRHVEGCDLCKARLRDERLLRAMYGPGGAGVAGDHLDDETLAAYVDQRLEPSRMRDIDRHLAHCDECLADYVELKKLVDAPATAPVPPHLHDLAVEGLSVRTLGTLYLSVHGNRVFAFFMTEAERQPLRPGIKDEQPDRESFGFAQMMELGDPVVREDSKPRRRSGALSMRVPWFSRIRRSAATEDESLSRALVPVDDSLVLEIDATTEMINFRALDPASGKPRAGMVVHIEFDQDRGYEHTTDETGRVREKLPPADVRLRIVLPGPPTCAIDIQVS